MEEVIITDILGFDWDTGNSTKSWIKHRVSIKEQEEAFFDKNKRVFKDTKHSLDEERFLLFAKTKKRRNLTIAFTKRKEKIRCISARSMKRKEVLMYEKTIKIT